MIFILSRRSAGPLLGPWEMIHPKPVAKAFEVRDELVQAARLGGFIHLLLVVALVMVLVNFFSGRRHA